MLYTSLNYNDVKNMTITQYYDLILAISSKQSFDVQSNAVGLTGEFDDDINPFYSIQDEAEKDRKMTVEEASELATLLS